jgi:hypothetical protein
MNALENLDKEYTLEEVKKIKRSVYLEKEDRVNKKLAIKFNSPIGRKEINERTTTIARSLLKLNVTINDIILFRKCKSMEAKDRRLIDSSEDDDGVILWQKDTIG